MNVREIMTIDVASCHAGDSLERAAQLMWEHDCGAIPVVDDDGKPIAMVTDRDLAMASYTQGKPLWAMPVSLAMSKTLTACGADETIGIAEALMRSQRVRRLPVIDGSGRLVGILSLNDIAVHGHRKSKKSIKRDELSAESIASTLAAICVREPSERAAAE